MTDPDHELREVGGFACPAGFFHLFFTRYKVGGGGGGGAGRRWRALAPLTAA